MDMGYWSGYRSQYITNINGRYIKKLQAEKIQMDFMWVNQELLAIGLFKYWAHGVTWTHVN